MSAFDNDKDTSKYLMDCDDGRQVYNLSPIKENLISWIEEKNVKYLIARDEVITEEKIVSIVKNRGDAWVVIAVDNRYGLSNFAGAKLDNNGKFFSAIEENVPNSFSLNTLLGIIDKAGEDSKNALVYYPYPDMYLPLEIFSDDYLPKTGELTNNFRNFGRERLYGINEAKAFDNIIMDGEFKRFANSYVIIIGACKEKLPVFVKFSNDRAKKYNMCTKIYADKRVIKEATTKEAKAHIDNLLEAKPLFDKRYEGFKEKYGINVSFNKCERLDDMRVSLEYISKISLEEKLCEYILKEDFENVKKLIELFTAFVKYNNDAIENIDLIFKNIFVDKDEWTILDYEWTTKSIPIKKSGLSDFIIQRAVYYFVNDNKEVAFAMDKLYEFANVTKPVLRTDCYEKDNEFEKEFQALVNEDHYSLGALYGKLGKTVYGLDYLIAKEKMQTEKETATTSVPGAKITRNGELFTFEINMLGLKEVDIFPAKAQCFINLREVSSKCDIYTNGEKFSKRLYGFEETAPKLTFRPKKETDKLIIKMYVGMYGNGESPIFESVFNRIKKSFINPF